MTGIRVIDFETDGMAPPDDVLEVGWCDLTREGETWEIGTPASTMHGIPGPARPMKPDARATHHIQPWEIKGQPPFWAPQLVADATAAGAIILAAHAWHFESQWIPADILGELRPLCTWKAAMRVWPDAPSHSNSALRYWLEDQGFSAPVHELTQPPHRAGPDAYVTAHLLSVLLAFESARQMVAWTKEPALYPRCPIGEKQGWRGKAWADMEGGALHWITRQDGPSGIEPDVRWCAQRELNRRIEISPP
jgi:exodeoxyribonuclease X